VVIDGLERLAADLDNARQASRARVALVNPDPVSLLGQAIRHRQTARPAPTTAISPWLYATETTPSRQKSAAPFYAGYFAVLGSRAAAPRTISPGTVVVSPGRRWAGPLYARVGGSGAFLAAAVLSCALFVAWLPPGAPAAGSV